MLSIDKEPVPGIKWTEALNLLVEIMVQEGFDKKSTLVIYYILKQSLTRKRTIYPKSIFNEELRKILRKFKEALDVDWHKKVSDEISRLFYDDPTNKIRAFIKDNNDYIIIFLTSISIAASIVMPVILKYV